MKTDLKKLVISLLLWTVLNAGLVVLFEKAVGSVTAEVIASTAFSLLWVLFAVIFCRKAEASEE